MSQRLVVDAYTRSDKAACAYFVAAICRTNSNQFVFVRQIAATKFCRSDNDFRMSHEAICCSNLPSDVSQRFVASCVSAFTSMHATLQGICKTFLHKKFYGGYCLVA